jgi:serine O-acetyltransferase
MNGETNKTENSMRLSQLVSRTIDELLRRNERALSEYPLDLYEISIPFRSDLIDRSTEDLNSLLERDPALMGEPLYALSKNGPFVATLLYRVAHQIWLYAEQADKRRQAMAISHIGRVLSGAEIHPAAQIGRRFVLDHATNTVIGASCIIGDDCYILNGVILGARGIADNPPGKRHPTIGNRVQIGSCTCVLGNVNIGDDVFIGPYSLITRDIPSGTLLIGKSIVDKSLSSEGKYQHVT